MDGKKGFFALTWHTVPCLPSLFIEGKKQSWEMRRVEWWFSLKASQEKENSWGIVMLDTSINWESYIFYLLVSLEVVRQLVWMIIVGPF